MLRIGRTGRCGKTGLATTYINKNQDESILLDLKHLLREGNQTIPPFLSVIKDTEDYTESKIECSFCGGLGHRMNNCHKIHLQKIKLSSSAGHNVHSSHGDILSGSRYANTHGYGSEI